MYLFEIPRPFIRKWGQGQRSRSSSKFGIFHVFAFSPTLEKVHIKEQVQNDCYIVMKICYIWSDTIK